MAAQFRGRVEASSDADGGGRAPPDGIVNTTPVGMAKYPGTPFDTSLLVAATNGSPTSSISRPRRSCCAQARALGCRTLAGTGMAIYQAVRAFELFTGQRGRPSRHGRPFRGGRMNAVTRRDCRGSKRSEPFAT